jgi:hypothetical protein
MVDAPPYPKESDVKESDACQVVYKITPGGFLIICKGKKCSEEMRCSGSLQKRKKNAPKRNWEDVGEPEDYDKDYLYRCCKGLHDHDLER